MSKKSEYIIERMQEFNPYAMLLTGFDECLFGIVKTFSGMVFVYNEDQIIEQLSKDMLEEDAWEYFYYNILGSYVGEYSPVYLTGV